MVTFGNFIIKKQSTFFAFLITLFMLAGCSLTPDYERPTVSAPAWKGTEFSGSTKIAADWWKDFGSDELDTLMERALAYNNDLQASLQRIEQARAELQIAGASLLPSASVTAEALETSEISGDEEEDMPSFASTAGISYELDLFGANRARAEAARETLIGTQYAHDALGLVVMGDVAQNYFNVLNLKERHRIARENVKSAEDLLGTVKARFQIGARTALEIAQQETVLSNAQAEVAALEQELAVAQNALAVLVGEPPQTFSVASENLNAVKAPSMGILQPSELLERRPDIKSAEAALTAANADIGAARAAFFPSVNLGANLLLAANPSSAAMALASSLYAPIFQGGRLDAEQRLRLYGMDDQAIAELKKKGKFLEATPFYAPADGTVSMLNVRKGAYVEEGAMVLSLQDYSQVWIQAHLPVRDMQFLAVGTPAIVTIDETGESFKAAVDFIYPVTDPQSRNGLVRLVLENLDGKLKTDALVSVVFEANSHPRLAVPVEAVMYGKDGGHVIADLGDGYFRPVKVKTGITADGLTEIVSGIKEGEKIITSGQFMIDAESSLSGGMAGMADTGEEAGNVHKH